MKLSIWTTLAHGHHDPQIFFFIIGYGCSRVKTYSLQSLSVINPKIPIFLNLQRALSQLPSFIRSAAGQAVFSLQVLLQTSLCDRRCRTDICVLICLSLLPLCLPLLHTLHQEGCFHWQHLSWSTLEHIEPGSPTQFLVLYQEVSGSLLDITWPSQWVSTFRHFFLSANFCLSKETLLLSIFVHWSRPHELCYCFAAFF